jgi:hypothetical protein
MEWEPITITGRKVRGPNSQYAGLLDVDIELSHRPPKVWARFFENPSGIGISLSMHPPTLSGSTVRITPPDDGVEKYAQHIEERLAHTNQWFEETALPQINAAEERQRAEDEAEAERLQEAQRKLDEM